MTTFQKNLVVLVAAAIAFFIGVTDAQAPSSCPAGIPENGSSCAGVVPQDKASVMCGGERTTGLGTPEAKIEIIECTCDGSAVWTCTTVRTETPAPAPPGGGGELGCPERNSDAPLTGDSCQGVLGLGITGQTCMFLQTLPDRSTESITCDCASSTMTWTCDGVLSPIAAPTLAPAGSLVPVSIQPATASPASPVVTANCPEKGTPPPVHGSSCAGVLPTDLPSATCTWTQTSSVNGVTTGQTTICTCSATDSLWDCGGEGSVSKDTTDAVIDKVETADDMDAELPKPPENGAMSASAAAAMSATTLAVATALVVVGTSIGAFLYQN